MTPSEKRKLISKRDAAKREAEKFEKQAEGKSQFMQSHFLEKAKVLRAEETNCNFRLNN